MGKIMALVRLCKGCIAEQSMWGAPVGRKCQACGMGAVQSGAAIGGIKGTNSWALGGWQLAGYDSMILPSVPPGIGLQPDLLAPTCQLGFSP